MATSVVTRAEARAIAFYLASIMLSLSFNHMVLIEISDSGNCRATPRKRRKEMRRLWVVGALVCFICSGSLMAFGEEQKVDKETYQKQAEKTLEVFKQKMSEMKDRASELKMESREKFDQEMKVLKKKKETADQKLEKLKSATAESWDTMKADTDKAVEELGKQYDKTMSRFRKK
jgi:hypothetical protein